MRSRIFKARVTRAIAVVVAAVMAALVGPAPAFAASGGAGGSYSGGSGATNPDHDIILSAFDDIRVATPGDPSAMVRGGWYAEQGWGEDSITFALNEINTAMGQTPSPLSGSGHLGGTTEGDFRTICRTALADATARSSDGQRASRVVGVYFTMHREDAPRLVLGEELQF